MRFLIAAISAATFLVSVTTAQADKRVAFVVGNGAYKNVAALPNPRSTPSRWPSFCAMSGSTS